MRRRDVHRAVGRRGGVAAGGAGAAAGAHIDDGGRSLDRHVEIICALGPPAVLAARAATTSIPIVFVTGADPIKFGFVASFNRPGGNITGIWIDSTALADKRLQLLHDLVPHGKSFALLVNPTSPVAAPQTRDAQAAAQSLGLSYVS